MRLDYVLALAASAGLASASGNNKGKCKPRPKPSGTGPHLGTVSSVGHGTFGPGTLSEPSATGSWSGHPTGRPSDHPTGRPSDHPTGRPSDHPSGTGTHTSDTTHGTDSTHTGTHTDSTTGTHTDSTATGTRTDSTATGTHTDSTTTATGTDSTTTATGTDSTSTTGSTQSTTATSTHSTDIPRPSQICKAKGTRTSPPFKTSKKLTDFTFKGCKALCAAEPACKSFSIRFETGGACSLFDKPVHADFRFRGGQENILFFDATCPEPVVDVSNSFWTPILT